MCQLVKILETQKGNFLVIVVDHQNAQFFLVVTIGFIGGKRGNEEKVSPNLMETATLKIAKRIGDLQPCEKGKICLYMVLVQRL